MKNLPVTSRPVRLGFGALCLATLVACGGGTTTTMVTEDRVVPTPTGSTPTTPTTPVTPTGPLTPAQERTAATALVNRFAPAMQPTYTALSAVPTTGAAVYEGYFYGNLANRSDAVTDSLLGVLNMRVGFTSTSVTVSGTVTGLSDARDTDLTGTLRLSNGALNRGGSPVNDATLTANVAGTLTDGAGRDLVLGVRLEGDFLGAVPDGVGGEALGAVTVNGVSQDFDGGFIAAR